MKPPRFSVVPYCLAAAFAFSAPARAADTLSPVDARKAADQTITERNLHAYLSFIASDELQGRDTPSVGLDTAARYIATFLERWGFEPAGGSGSYFQRIILRSAFLDNAGSTATLAGKTLRVGDDFLPADASEGSPGIAAPVPVVYAGNGWLIKSKGVDAFRGVDVRGRIVLLAGGGALPPGVTFGDLSRAGRGTDWLSPDAYAKASGAVGIVYLPGSVDATAWAKDRQTAPPTRRLGTVPVGLTEGGATGRGRAGLPAITLSPDVAQTLLADEAVSLDAAIGTKTAPKPASFALAADKTLAMTLAVRAETAPTQNIVAIWRGGDPALRDQYVAFGAHYDHLGVAQTPDASGDRIYNGADDDGSGTCALISMAETLGAHPDKRPRRSMLFVWHCGEEKGLWGSGYFTEHPTVPLKTVVTQLNIDMIGRSKPAGDTKPRDATLSDANTVYVIGARMLAPELGEIVEQVNKNDSNLTLDYRYDDPKDLNRFYYRSDHYNYARRGVPIAFFFDGVHEDYHRVSDEVSKIDFAKYARVTRTIFQVGVTLADRDSAPAVTGKARGDSSVPAAAAAVGH